MRHALRSLIGVELLLLTRRRRGKLALPARILSHMLLIHIDLMEGNHLKIIGILPPLTYRERTRCGVDPSSTLAIGLGKCVALALDLVIVHKLPRVGSLPIRQILGCDEGTTGLSIDKVGGLVPALNIVETETLTHELYHTLTADLPKDRVNLVIGPPVVATCPCSVSLVAIGVKIRTDLGQRHRSYADTVSK